MTHGPLGPIYLLGVYASWGSLGVVISVAEMGTATALWLSVMSALFFTALALAMKMRFSRTEFTSMLPFCIARVINICVVYAMYALFTAGVAGTFAAASALVTICILAPYRKEKVTLSVNVLTLIGVVGVFFVSRENLNEGLFAFDVKLIVPVIAMFATAYGVLLWRDSTPAFSPVKNLMYMHVWSTIMSVPAVVLISIVFGTPIAPTHNAFYLFMIFALAGIGDMLFVIGQKHSSVSLNGVLSPLTAVFTAVVATIFTHQEMQWWQWSGLSTVVFATALAAYVNRNRKENVLT